MTPLTQSSQMAGQNGSRSVPAHISRGPWHVEDAPSKSSMRSIRTDSGQAIAFVNRLPNAQANARLITAAPELLAVLRGVLLDAGSDISTEWLERAATAIAQAEGREP